MFLGIQIGSFSSSKSCLVIEYFEGSYCTICKVAINDYLYRKLFVAGDLCSIEVINNHKYIGDFTVRFIVTAKSNINGRSLK